jgi:hypothetical protein
VVAELFHTGDGRTHKKKRHDEANSHLSQFFERASKLRFLLLSRPQPRHNTFEQILLKITFKYRTTAHIQYAGMICATLIIYFVFPSYLTASIFTKSIRSTFRSFIPTSYPNYRLLLQNSFNGKIEVPPETFRTMRAFPFAGVYMLCNVRISLCYHVLR